jgi:hypothetical protein
MNTHMDARPWLARTQRQYATMLLARRQSCDRDKAAALLDAALATARELGCVRSRNPSYPRQLT